MSIRPSTDKLADVRGSNGTRSSTHATLSHLKSSHENDHYFLSNSKEKSSVNDSLKLPTNQTELSIRDEITQSSPTELLLLEELYFNIHTDTRGIGSQFLHMTGIGYHDDRSVDAYLSRPSNCPYHGPILEGSPAAAYGQQILAPMDRYLISGPEEQHAMFCRPDNGLLSTNKGCQCNQMMERSEQTIEHERWR